MKQKTRHFYSFGPFRLDASECLLNLDGKPVPLAPKAFEALLMLVENAGQLVDKDDLMRRLWPGTFVEEGNVAKHVSVLRKILSEATNGREYIETIPKRGYRFVVEVRKIEASEAGSQPQTIPGASMSGKKVSHYRVLQVLGGGGMGVVYTAEDLKLGRRVALKFLPEEIASNAKVLERFEREARAASALDHPNICTIHEFGEHEGRPFIAMSLLEGQNLRDQIAARAAPFATDELLYLAIQIGDGLAAAHEKGIVHRDIKPANIFITNRSEVKILDFGLAKLAYAGDRETLPYQEAPSQEATSVPANDLSLSLTGVAMGTAPYMSPEQVRGDKLDARSDLFSFGLVIYEMATRKRTFSGDTAAALQDAILNRTPVPAKDLNPDLPPKLENIINKCLEKDRNLRYQQASEIRTDLQRLKRDTTSGKIEVVAGPARARKFSWQWAVAILLVIVIGVGTFAWLSSSPPPPRVLATTQLTRDGISKSIVATDGSRLYSNELGDTFRIVQVSTGGGETSPIATPFDNAYAEAISPDHTQLLVGNSLDRESPLWSLPLPSGAPRRLDDIVAHSAAWSPDGRHLVFCKTSNIYEANADGTDPHKLPTASGRSFSPRFSPDATRIRFDRAENNSYALWEIRADGSDLHPVLPGWPTTNSECCGVHEFTPGAWTPDGRYYFFLASTPSGRNVLAVREPSGLFHRHSSAPFQLTTGPLSFQSLVPSADGKKLFVSARQGRAELVRYDPKFKQFVPFLAGISAGEVEFSRDGKWVTYVTYPEHTLWRSRVEGSDRLQLTYPPVLAGLPHWSPDGARIAYVDIQPGRPYKIFLISSQGAARQEMLPENHTQVDATWSPDGKKIAFGRIVVSGSSEVLAIYIIELTTHQVSTVPGSENLFSPRWSPDGQHLAALAPDSSKLLLFDSKPKNGPTGSLSRA